MSLFNQIRVKRPGRNAFNLSHEKKLTMNMGELVPIYMQEVVPGDKFNVNTETFVRLSPMLAPVMHRVNLYTHFFFVPWRLVWSNWETFITGGPDGTSVPSFPQIILNATTKPYFLPGLLPDYMGLPNVDAAATISPDIKFNALPFRAYQKIYNEYYRDQNLSIPVDVPIDDAVPNTVNLITMRKRAWEKDYFTSALPWAQRGGEVELPTDIQYRKPGIIKQTAAGETPAPDGSLFKSIGAGGLTGYSSATGTGGTPAYLDNIESLGITVNDLRRSVRLQEWLEKNARGGARYIEQILSHFGVKSSDARLQRPEFLGGSKQPIVISEVLATFNNAETPGGQMYGHGVSAGGGHGFNRFFEEHGVILGIMSVLPRTNYQQGVPKLFTKLDKFDYYYPEFANLGEQEIKLEELYFDPVTQTDNKKTFGYTPRYAEYKFNPGTCHGDFRNTLDFWHMGRKFSAAPALNEQFVMSDPTTRIWAVEDTSQKLYVQLYNQVKAVRPMPHFGTPTL